MLHTLSQVQVLVVPRSTEGMKAAAACFRQSGNPDMQLLFTDSLSRADMPKWPQGTKVAILDHAASIDFVNNQYKILFIAAVNQNSWGKLLAELNVEVPEVCSARKSETCCELLAREFGQGADSTTKALLVKDNNIFEDSFSKAAKECNNLQLSALVKYTALLNLV